MLLLSRSVRAALPALDPRLVALPLALAVAALAGLTAPRPADAAPYEVWSCRDAAGAPVGTKAWRLSYDFAPPGNIESSDTCASGGGGGGGGYRVGLRPAMSHGLSGIELRFEAPRGTQILDYELWRSAAVADAATAPSLYQSGVDEIVGGGPVNDPYGPQKCDSQLSPSDCGTDAADPLAAVNRLARETPGPFDALKLFSRCLESTCNAAAPVAVETTLYRSRVTLDDPAPPTAAVTGGTLVGGGPLSGLATLAVAGHDEESGVSAVSLSIDGGTDTTVASGNALNGCHLPYSDSRPCPSDSAPLFLVDTSSLTPGFHTAAGSVADAAGNVTDWVPFSFEVAAPVPTPLPDPPAPAPAPVPPAPTPPAPPVQGGTPDNGVPAVATPRVRLTVGRVRAGRAPRVSGTVRTAGGTPIAGARIVLSGRPLGASTTKQRKLGTATSDARGRFATRRVPVGAWSVTASFAPWAGATPTVTKRLRARSKLALTASATPRRLKSGRRVTLRGRLRGAGPAARGTLVQIEAIVNGRWRPVGRTRLRTNGDWRWRYRFTRVTRPTRFSFRATVASAPAWPWSTQRSRRVPVRVDVP